MTEYAVQAVLGFCDASRLCGRLLGILALQGGKVYISVGLQLIYLLVVAMADLPWIPIKPRVGRGGGANHVAHIYQSGRSQCRVQVQKRGLLA